MPKYLKITLHRTIMLLIFKPENVNKLKSSLFILKYYVLIYLQININSEYIYLYFRRLKARVSQHLTFEQ